MSDIKASRDDEMYEIILRVVKIRTKVSIYLKIICMPFVWIIYLIVIKVFLIFKNMK